MHTYYLKILTLFTQKVSRQATKQNESYMSQTLDCEFIEAVIPNNEQPLRLEFLIIQVVIMHKPY